MELAKAIAGYRLVGLDTSPFIYLFEKHPQYFDVIQPVFSRLDVDPQFRAVTSVVTLIEVCVLPLKEDKSDLIDVYTRALLNSATVSTISVDAAIARKSAELRARYNLRTPDAIQLATALTAGAEAFITNDATLKRVTEIPILVLDDYIRQSDS